MHRRRFATLAALIALAAGAGGCGANSVRTARTTDSLGQLLRGEPEFLCQAKAAMCVAEARALKVFERVHPDRGSQRAFCFRDVRLRPKIVATVVPCPRHRSG